MRVKTIGLIVAEAGKIKLRYNLFAFIKYFSAKVTDASCGTLGSDPLATHKVCSRDLRTMWSQYAGRFLSTLARLRVWPARIIAEKLVRCKLAQKFSS